MRLDKFLKISLIFKTRSSAEKAIENKNVFVNDKLAKPATNVAVDDVINIIYPLKKVWYKINELHEKSVPKKTAREMATVIKEEKDEI